MNFSRSVLFHMETRVCLSYFATDCGGKKRMNFSLFLGKKYLGKEKCRCYF